MKAILVNQHGGPETLLYKDTHIRQPGAGEVLVRNQAIGLNFTDIYFRKGIYSPGSLPFTPGNEAAGEVVAVGETVEDFKVGDRVAYVMLLGAYAEESIVPVRNLVHLPEYINFEIAAAILLKGLTAQYLLRQIYKVGADSIILVHAAAGGVGSLLVQWAKYLGAIVIGTVGTAQKMEIAYKNGCDFVINYNEDDFVERVSQITEGKKCHVVYDSIGKATFPASLDCLRPLGYFVSFGSASGAIDHFNIGELATRGSLVATSPVLFDYIDNQENLTLMSKELFEMIKNKKIKIDINNRVPLEQSAKAHILLESRKTTGTTILLP